MKNTKIKELLEKKSKDLFKSNKDLTIVYLCSNGQGFTNKPAAERYADTLEDSKVYTFVKEEVAKKETEKQVKVEEKEEKAADTEQKTK